MRRKLFLFLFFGVLSILCLFLLRFPMRAAALAADGLTLWFAKMIPALFPFMVLSGVFLTTGFSDRLAHLAAPLLQPIFRTSDSCLFCILTGFFCGFPMGARVCAQSLQQNKISRREASWLLAFTNNIGPVYFSGYVLSLFPVRAPLTVWLGMYLLPLLYGLVLRDTLYRDLPASHNACRRAGDITARPMSGEAPLRTDTTRSDSGRRVFAPTAASARRSTNALTAFSGASLSSACLLSALHESILSAMNGIAQLGGYMVFFNLLNLFPAVFLAEYPALVRWLSPLLEITNGLSMLLPSERFWAYLVLPFGGLCCIAQTASCIHNTGLSLKRYIFHKLILTLLTAAWYLALPV